MQPDIKLTRRPSSLCDATFLQFLEKGSSVPVTFNDLSKSRREHVNKVWHRARRNLHDQLLNFRDDCWTQPSL